MLLKLCGRHEAKSEISTHHSLLMTLTFRTSNGGKIDLEYSIPASYGSNAACCLELTYGIDSSKIQYLEVNLTTNRLAHL
jgi:hypothetical protein